MAGGNVYADIMRSAVQAKPDFASIHQGFSSAREGIAATQSSINDALGSLTGKDVYDKNGNYLGKQGGLINSIQEGIAPFAQKAETDLREHLEQKTRDEALGKLEAKQNEADKLREQIMGRTTQQMQQDGIKQAAQDVTKKMTESIVSNAVMAQTGQPSLEEFNKAFEFKMESFKNRAGGFGTGKRPLADWDNRTLLAFTEDAKNIQNSTLDNDTKQALFSLMRDPDFNRWRTMEQTIGFEKDRAERGIYTPDEAFKVAQEYKKYTPWTSRNVTTRDLAQGYLEGNTKAIEDMVTQKQKEEAYIKSQSTINNSLLPKDNRFGNNGDSLGLQQGNTVQNQGKVVAKGGNNVKTNTQATNTPQQVDYSQNPELVKGQVLPNNPENDANTNLVQGRNIDISPEYIKNEKQKITEQRVNEQKFRDEVLPPNSYKHILFESDMRDSDKKGLRGLAAKIGYGYVNLGGINEDMTMRNISFNLSEDNPMYQAGSLLKSVGNQSATIMALSLLPGYRTLKWVRGGSSSLAIQGENFLTGPTINTLNKSIKYFKDVWNTSKLSTKAIGVGGVTMAGLGAGIAAYEALEKDLINKYGSELTDRIMTLATTDEKGWEAATRDYNAKFNSGYNKIYEAASSVKKELDLIKQEQDLFMREHLTPEQLQTIVESPEEFLKSIYSEVAKSINKPLEGKSEDEQKEIINEINKSTYLTDIIKERVSYAENYTKRYLSTSFFGQPAGANIDQQKLLDTKQEQIISEINAGVSSANGRETKNSGDISPLSTAIKYSYLDYMDINANNFDVLDKIFSQDNVKQKILDFYNTKATPNTDEKTIENKAEDLERVLKEQFAINGIQLKAKGTAFDRTTPNLNKNMMGLLEQYFKHPQYFNNAYAFGYLKQLAIMDKNNTKAKNDLVKKLNERY